jgi:hypothetical protein
MQQELFKHEPRATAMRSKRSAGAPQAIRTRGREQDMLEMFIGTWQVHGYNESATLGKGRATVTGAQKYVWVPGEFFVRGSWNHRFGARLHQGVSLLGFQPEHAAYFAHNYDNLGYVRVYVLSLAGHVWTFNGPCERATFTFSDDGEHYQESWELTKDGQTWQPLCALEATRFRV